MAFRNMTPIWLAVKDFQTTWFHVKLVIATIIAITADFAILFMLMNGWSNPIATALLLILTSVGLSAALLHLTKRTFYEMGVFKALGASRGTIAASLFIKLFITGLVGSMIGVVIGVPIGLFFTAYISLPLPAGSFASMAPLEVLLSTVLSCILGVLVGALAGGLLTWERAKLHVSEILVNVR